MRLRPLKLTRGDDLIDDEENVVGMIIYPNIEAMDQVRSWFELQQLYAQKRRERERQIKD